MGTRMIPEELQALDQWVVWRREHRDGKPTKVPYQPAAPSTRASTTDPATWADYATAGVVQDVDGIGFVFSENDPFCGVDLDACMKDGRLEPKAAAVVLTLDSYSEVSPSGAGAHCIVRAKLNGGRRRSGNVEMYDKGRYFCMTGNHLPDTPLEIYDRQAQLEEIRAELFPPEPKPQPSRPATVNSADDHELLELAGRAKNGADFDRLYRGDTGGYDSRSEADLALVSLLAFWTGPDLGRVDRLFRASGLMREKWTERRGDTTYGGQTIAKALEGRTEFYRPPSRRATEAADARPGEQSATPAYALEIDAKGNLLLPEKPSMDDVVGLCAWTTAVFGLDQRHPITGGKRRGVRGVTGCVELTRLDAQSLIIDPVTRLNVPLRLSEALTAHRLPSDDVIPPFRGPHCRDIAHAVIMLAGTDGTLTEAQETASILGTLMHVAEEADVKVTCHGSAAQRAEVVHALRHGYDEPIRYVRDCFTGAIVVTVRDLNEVAKKHMGGTLRHGWLEARMDSFGWVRRELQGYDEEPDGSRGQHREVGIYRGFLAGGTDDDS